MRPSTRIFALVGLAAVAASAQSMEKAVSKLGAEAARAYMTPLLSGYGSNLNSGWFHKAPPAVKRAFHVNAGVVSMGTLIGGSSSMNVVGSMPLDTTLSNPLVAAATNDPALRDSLRRRLSEGEFEVTFLGPTVTGAEDREIRVVFTQRLVSTGRAPTDTSILIPTDTLTISNLTGLVEGLRSISLFAPQINVGTFYGTNLTLRWLPKYESREEIGPIDLFGFGIQHNPAVWLKKPLPVDVTLGYFRQTLSGGFFEATGWAGALHVSKSYGWPVMKVTPYAGLQIEGSSFDVTYDLQAYDEIHRIKTTVEGENTYRATAGLSLRVLALNVNADANYAQQPSYSLGFMIGL